MPRNLDRRVELLFPIESPQLRKVLAEDLLQVALHDNVKVRQLLSNGDYTRLELMPEHAPLSSQDWFLENWKSRGAGAL